MLTSGSSSTIMIMKFRPLTFWGFVRGGTSRFSDTYIGMKTLTAGLIALLLRWEMPKILYMSVNSIFWY